MSMPSRYDVLVTEKNEKTGKTYYTNIGVAFVNKDSSISVKLRALPMGGELYLAIPRPKEEREASARSDENRGQRRSASEPRKVAPPRFPQQHLPDPAAFPESPFDDATTPADLDPDGIY